MDLAIINLVPWPALDGGHLAFMTFEAIRGRPMGERAQGEIVKWGFMGLMVLMVVIMANDVTALFTGKLDIRKREPVSAKDKGAESKSSESKSSDSNSSDSKSVESKSTEPKAAEPQSAETKATGSSTDSAATDEKKNDSAAPQESNSK
jgi:hypothetical protein